MERATYPSDLSDKEWRLLKPRLPPPKSGGRPITYSRREIVNAIRYVLCTGCCALGVAHWVFLADAAPRPAALAYRLPLLPHLAARWNLATGTPRLARHPATGAGSPGQSQRGDHRQPVGEDHGKRGPRGYDAGQRVTGRKRHIVVDTLGLLLAVVVHPANVQDRDGARLVLVHLLDRFPDLRVIWADGAYGGKLVAWARTVGGWTLELVRRPAQQHTFQVLPSGASPALGGGAHLRLAEPATTLEQGLRSIA